MLSQDSQERAPIPGLIIYDLSTWVSMLRLPPARRREKKRPSESIKNTLAKLTPTNHKMITRVQFETLVFWRKLCYPPPDHFHKFLESLDLPNNVQDAIDDDHFFQQEAVKVFQRWLDGTRGPTMSAEHIMIEKGLRRTELLELAEVYRWNPDAEERDWNRRQKLAQRKPKLQQLDEGQNPGE